MKWYVIFDQWYLFGRSLFQHFLTSSSHLVWFLLPWLPLFVLFPNFLIISSQSSHVSSFYKPRKQSLWKTTWDIVSWNYKPRFPIELVSGVVNVKAKYNLAWTCTLTRYSWGMPTRGSSSTLQAGEHTLLFSDSSYIGGIIQPSCTKQSQPVHRHINSSQRQGFVVVGCCCSVSSQEHPMPAFLVFGQKYMPTKASIQFCFPPFLGNILLQYPLQIFFGDNYLWNLLI